MAVEGATTARAFGASTRSSCLALYAGFILDSSPSGLIPIASVEARGHNRRGGRGSPFVVIKGTFRVEGYSPTAIQSGSRSMTKSTGPGSQGIPPS